MKKDKGTTIIVWSKNLSENIIRPISLFLLWPRWDFKNLQCIKNDSKLPVQRSTSFFIATYSVELNGTLTIVEARFKAHFGTESRSLMFNLFFYLAFVNSKKKVMDPCIMSYYIIIVYLMISLGLGNLENVFAVEPKELDRETVRRYWLDNGLQNISSNYSMSLFLKQATKLIIFGLSRYKQRTTRKQCSFQRFRTD